MTGFAQLMLAVAIVAVLAFVIVYATVRWWESEYGWNFMGNAVVTLALLVLIAAEVVLGSDYSGRDVYQPIVFGLIAVVFVTRSALLIRDQTRP